MNSELDSVDLNIRRDTERIRQKRRSKEILTAILDTEITNHTNLIWRPYG